MAAYSMGRKRVIAVLALTSILLITLDQRGTVVIDRARSLFHLLIEPFDTAARAITRPVLTAWRGVFDYRDLEQENALLRAEIEAQRGAFIEAKAAIYEYQELLALNRLVGTGGFPSVTAQVQGGSPGNFQNTVEINKGGLDGIAVGMPVVNGAGLVGKVTQVFPSSAIVQLVVDPGFSMRAKVLTPVDEPDPSIPTRPGLSPSTTLPGADAGASTTTTSTTTTTTTIPSTTTTTSPPILLNDPLGPVPLVTTTTSTLPPALGGGTTVPPPPVEVQRETGTVVGQGVGRPLLLRFVDDSSTTGRIKEGSTVETAGGLQSLAPPGIPIGTVSRVAKQSGSRVPIIEVEIGAGDLSRLNFLVVLLYVPNTGAG
jgi:rod shape-determining protein MreC